MIESWSACDQLKLSLQVLLLTQVTKLVCTDSIIGCLACVSCNKELHFLMNVQFLLFHPGL